MKILLWPISFLYHIILSIRHQLYDWHLLGSKRFELPVIGVGNLALGGTGKTPHVEYLIRLLSEQSRVCVVSRGFGRHTKGFQEASDGCRAEDIGDEPMQYYSKFSGLKVVVDEDRNEAIERMREMENPPEVYLLDDAFQHRSTQAGLNILLTEYGRLYTEDYLVPAGRLRDVRSAAHRAQWVVVTKCPETIDDLERDDIRQRLHLQEGQQLYFSSMVYEPLQAVTDTGFTPSRDCTVLCFSGIADAKPLIEQLKKNYREVVEMRFPDHHRFSEDNLSKLLKAFADIPSKDKFMVTTEKDYARLRNTSYICKFESAPVFVQPIRVRFHEEKVFDENILHYVRQNNDHC